ncbi:MAG TPA: phage tail protein [Allosphingosinicella sp.]|jgi:hypothetical protein
MAKGPPLYALLPEYYRTRDAETRFALRALTEVLDGPRRRVEADIEALYQDWFVETCADWVLPYLARLVGLDQLSELAADRRVLVADSIGFARRKGTHPALEHALAALTGWPVQVAFRAGSGGTGAEAGAGAVARYWDEPVYRLREVTPHCAGFGRYRFHPMGIDCPLFAAPRPYAGMEAVFDRSADAPVPLAGGADAATIARALSIGVENEEGAFDHIAPERMALADLGDWRVPAHAQAHVFIDPLRGRFLLAQAPRGRIAVGFAYAAPGNVGGGPYERLLSPPDEGCWVAYVHSDARPDIKADTPVVAYRTLAGALEAFRAVPTDGVIRILDSGTYDLEGCQVGAASVCAHDPNAPRRLAIEALSGESPTLRGTLRLADAGTGLQVSLNGLWIDGRVEIEGEVEARIAHCTVHHASERHKERHPAEPAPSPAIHTTAPQGAAPKLSLHACLTGPLSLAVETLLDASDCAIDGRGLGLAISGGAGARFARCTLLGGAALGSVSAFDTLFAEPLSATGSGGPARHCFLPESAASLAGAGCFEGPPPLYQSAVFGTPGYARLDPNANAAIRTGGSNGSEIGLFNGGHNAQRVALMQAHLERQLPIGMAFALERQALAHPGDQGSSSTP